MPDLQELLEKDWITPHGAYSNMRADNELMALAPRLAALVLEAEETLQLWADCAEHESGCSALIADSGLDCDCFTSIARAWLTRYHELREAR